MTESKKPLVADVLDYEHDIAPYKFIKIFSGVGSGKTQLACKLILGDKERRIPRQTVLLITSRRSTVEDSVRWGIMQPVVQEHTGISQKMNTQTAWAATLIISE